MNPDYAARFPAIPSPAACPKCGSMDLSWPWCGRRTGVYLSRCLDCGESIRSVEPFTIKERKRTPGTSVELMQPRSPDAPRPNDDAMVSANEARMAVMKALKIPPQRSREPGEEG